ncbi:hypothetical protein J6590_067555 [Homalodisca vitripennis]|nr:hypothetical protein J6590_067555 [Homalodisca vitripennis]
MGHRNLFNRYTNGAETTVPAVTAPICYIVLILRYKPSSRKAFRTHIIKLLSFVPKT